MDDVMIKVRQAHNTYHPGADPQNLLYSRTRLMSYCDLCIPQLRHSGKVTLMFNYGSFQRIFIVILVCFIVVATFTIMPHSLNKSSFACIDAYNSLHWVFHLLTGVRPTCALRHGILDAFLKTMFK